MPIIWMICQIKCNTYDELPSNSSLGVLYFMHLRGLLFIKIQILFQFLRVHFRQIHSFRIKLPQSIVRILIGSFLPGTLGITEIGFASNAASIFSYSANSFPLSKVIVFTSSDGSFPESFYDCRCYILGRSVFCGIAI